MHAANGAVLPSMIRFSAVSGHCLLSDLCCETSACIECDCKGMMVFWGLVSSRLDAGRTRTLFDRQTYSSDRPEMIAVMLEAASSSSATLSCPCIELC